MMNLNQKDLKDLQPLKEHSSTCLSHVFERKWTGRGCAYGRKQMEYMSKEENNAPTVSIEFCCCHVIDSMENRDVCYIDIPGAFMLAEMHDTVQMKMEAGLAELLVVIYPKLHRKYLRNEMVDRFCI